MKNRTASYIYLATGILSFVYYVVLKCANFSFVPSFAECWLVLSAILIVAFVFVHKRSAEKKYCFLEPCKKWNRNFVKIALSICILIAVVNLIFICTPTSSKNEIETDYLILLGGGINQDGTLAATPRKRLERAVEYLKEHPKTKIIVTGGKGRFAPCTEAPVLAKNLVELGVDSGRILEEDKALDTIQNFSYSVNLIANRENVSIEEVLKEPVTVVTSGFHLRRAMRLAKRMGFESIQGVAAKTPAVYVANCYCREICSYIKLNLRIMLTGKPCSLVE